MEIINFANPLLIVRFGMRKYLILSLLLSIFTASAQTVFEQDTVLACQADSLELDAGEGYDSYSWNTGESTQAIWVEQTGTYIVTVDSLGTLITDTTYINILRFDIVQNDTTICYGDSIILTIDTVFEEQNSLLWDSGDTTFFTWATPQADTSAFYVYVTDSAGINTCADSMIIYLYPRMIIDTLIQLNMGCPNSCKAQILPQVSGGEKPYLYQWNQYPPSLTDSIGIGLCDNVFNDLVVFSDTIFTENDAIVCSIDTTIEVETYDIPEVDILFEPDSVVYLQRPMVTFSYENLSLDSTESDTFRIIDYVWDFGTGATSTNESPSYSYSNTGTFDVKLKFTTFYSCKDSVSEPITVKPVNLKIPNVFTPNGDQWNQYFKIEIEEEGGEGGDAKADGNGEEKFINDYYLSNTLVVFDRWGRKVYEKDNYENDWDGDNLSDGTYFYILVCKGQVSTDEYKGVITIMRGSQ